MDRGLEPYSVRKDFRHYWTTRARDSRIPSGNSDQRQHSGRYRRGQALSPEGLRTIERRNGQWIYVGVAAVSTFNRAFRWVACVAPFRNRQRSPDSSEVVLVAGPSQRSATQRNISILNLKKRSDCAVQIATAFATSSHRSWRHAPHGSDAPVSNRAHSWTGGTGREESRTPI